MGKLKELIKKFCTKEIILYLVFGVLTTVVNMGAFFIFTNLLKLDSNTSNIIAVSFAVLFAYFTNRSFVFKSDAKEFGEKVVEFCRFILGRLFTIAIEIISGNIFFNNDDFHDLIVKCSVTIIVVILNFFISKFFTFNTNKKLTTEDK